MKAKTQFMKMYYKLPSRARDELVFNFTTNPMTLRVVSLEIRNDTKLGKTILNSLGYEDAPSCKKEV